MSDKIKNIQERLDENTKRQCDKEWNEAKKKVNEILSPFFVGFDDLPVDQRKEQQDQLRVRTEIMWNGVRIGHDMKVPQQYVARRCSEESSAFIDKIESLREDVDNLFSEVEGMQR